MRLEALLSQNMQCDAAHANVEITGLTADSRIVAPGYLFAALPGEHVDGNRFVAQAVAQGAAAVLTAQPDAGLSVPVLYDETRVGRWLNWQGAFSPSGPNARSA